MSKVLRPKVLRPTKVVRAGEATACWISNSDIVAFALYENGISASHHVNGNKVYSGYPNSSTCEEVSEHGWQSAAIRAALDEIMKSAAASIELASSMIAGLKNSESIDAAIWVIEGSVENIKRARALKAALIEKGEI